MKHFKLLILLTSLIIVKLGYCQKNDSIKYKIVEGLSHELQFKYLDSSIAKAMSNLITYKMKNNLYDSSLNLDEFTHELTMDLRKVSNDAHISVIPLHFKWSDSNYHSTINHKKFKRWLYKPKQDDFKYGDVKMINNKIGYLELFNFQQKDFFDTSTTKKIKLKNVMNFLENAEALIIDLRENHGGIVEQAIKFCSYFLSQGNKYCISNDAIYRYKHLDTLHQGKIHNKLMSNIRLVSDYFLSKKIIILISQQTFSSAELATYLLKKFIPNIAVIGTKTIGGGNAHFGYSTNKYFTAIIPSTKFYDEENNNYSLEAKGIKPDIEINADSAYSKALEILGITTKTEKYFNKKVSLQENINDSIKKSYSDYIGNYRKIKIKMENENLFLYYGNVVRLKLYYKASDLFLLNDFEFVQFIRNENNLIKEINIKHRDGYIEKFRKID